MTPVKSSEKVDSGAIAQTASLLPFALAADEPGRIDSLSPLAIVILGGLLSSTLLNMVVLPSLSLKFGKMTKKMTA